MAFVKIELRGKMVILRSVQAFSNPHGRGLALVRPLPGRRSGLMALRIAAIFFGVTSAPSRSVVSGALN